MQIVAQAPPTSKSKKTPSLGNLASISAAATKKHTISSSQRAQSQRFFLLDAARRILRTHNAESKSGNHHRTRTCLAVRYDKSEDIGITLNGDEDASCSGLTNLVTCRSISSCPVCAHRIMREKAQMIQRAITWSQQNNLIPVMVTLTASHNKYMRLDNFVAQFKSAWRNFSSSRQWRNFKKTYRVKHWIASREITRQAIADNGWHYHMHVLLFLDAGLVATASGGENMEGKLSEYWLGCLTTAGLHGTSEHALSVSAGRDTAARYLTKLGITRGKAGQLEYELAGNANKGDTIWDVLNLAAYGDIRAEYLYLEYVESLAGENWITMSHGLQALIADIEIIEEEIAEKDRLILWTWVSQEDWNVVIRNHAVRDVLHCAARYRDRSKLANLIQGLSHNE